MKAVVSPFGHDIRGSWPFTPFDTRVDAVANGGVTGGDVLVLWGGTDIHPSFYKAKAHSLNQVAGSDFVSEGLPDLGDSEGKLPAHGGLDVWEINEDSLSGFRAQEDSGGRILYRSHLSLEHQIEHAGLSARVLS